MSLQVTHHLRSLLSAATPGPWRTDLFLVTAPKPWPGARPEEVIADVRPTAVAHIDRNRDVANAKAIAAAVNAAPALLDALDALNRLTAAVEPVVNPSAYGMPLSWQAHAQICEAEEAARAALQAFEEEDRE